MDHFHLFVQFPGSSFTLLKNKTICTIEVSRHLVYITYSIKFSLPMLIWVEGFFHHGVQNPKRIIRFKVEPSRLVIWLYVFTLLKEADEDLISSLVSHCVIYMSRVVSSSHPKKQKQLVYLNIFQIFAYAVHEYPSVSTVIIYPCLHLLKSYKLWVWKGRWWFRKTFSL